MLASTKEATAAPTCYNRVARYVTKTPGSLLVPLLIYAVFVSGCVHLKDLRFALVRASLQPMPRHFSSSPH